MATQPNHDYATPADRQAKDDLLHGDSYSSAANSEFLEAV